MDILRTLRMKVEGRIYFLFYIYLDIFLSLKEFENAEDAAKAKDKLDGYSVFLDAQ